MAKICEEKVKEYKSIAMLKIYNYNGVNKER